MSPSVDDREVSQEVSFRQDTWVDMTVADSDDDQDWGRDIRVFDKVEFDADPCGSSKDDHLQAVSVCRAFADVLPPPSAGGSQCKQHVKIFSQFGRGCG